ncbi:unnamed protein product [Camellia sinensis]
MAAESCVANAKYTYIHDNHKGSLETLDSHHVCCSKKQCKGIHCIPLCSSSHNNCLLSLSPTESIIIMPAFGVQLETRYSSGRIIHRFIPIEKILKPVLNECVTPVTCYWNLSLIVREEEELVLVFKELHPPVKMLIPIWKALCAATDNPVTQVPSR